MQDNLKEKLNMLSERFNTDLDIISLKALCNMPESEEILFAITGTLQRLVDKYPENEEILGLLPKKEKISLEELIKHLDETYPNNIEVITVKALSVLPESEDKEKAIKSSLERLLEDSSDDENIMEYLDIEEITPKEQDEDMVFVEGGSYIPSFFAEERKVFDLYVNKYLVTGGNALEIMGEKHNCFSILGLSLVPEINDKKPYKFDWIYALEYCNKLSIKHELKPVYIIEHEKLIKISQLDGKEVFPDEADFEKTEGYRLPTELEWEWFAFGGKKVLEGKKFPQNIFSLDELSDMAWGKENNNGQTLNGINVGIKKPNKLGLFDIFGNTCEIVYDTCTNGYLQNDKSYSYENNIEKHVLRGGNTDIELSKLPYFRGFKSWMLGDFHDQMKYVGMGFSLQFDDGGIRVVRTAKPKRK